ncbi:MAG: hypothetical protein K4571_13200 [Deltaproteobacteria bacterium]
MVRAIDLQQSILQTTPAEKVQQIQQQHADMQQRYYQLKLSEEDRLAQEKVNHFKEADKAKIKNREEKQDKKKGANQQHTNQTELLTGESGDESGEGGLINITV